MSQASSCRYNASMHQTLRIHPDSVCSAVTQIEVQLMRLRAYSLVLAYVVTGKISDLAMPPAAAAARTDQLWRHTCFEAFVRNSPGTVYYEFNFAPSTRWAAYQFNGYRTGMRVATEISAPNIVVDSGPERFILQASLKLHQLLLSPAATWQFGLSAVIEESSGNQSYWALAHPAGKADFHHFDCFALEVHEA
jgi:hypothetical protein